MKNWETKDNYLKLAFDGPKLKVTSPAVAGGGFHFGVLRGANYNNCEFKLKTIPSLFLAIITITKIKNR